jgi:GTP-binding protein HflX
LAFSDGKKRAWLYEQGIVKSEKQGETGPVLTVDWTIRQKEAFSRMT